MVPINRNLVIWINLIGLLILGIVGVGYARHVQSVQDAEDNEQPWMAYINSPFPVLQEIVVAGRVVTMKVKRHSSAKQRRIYAVAANLISEDHPGQAPIALAVSSVYIDPGDTEITSALNRTPVATIPGWYHLEGVGEIHGEHHTFLIPWSSQSFQIIAPLQQDSK